MFHRRDAMLRFGAAGLSLPGLLRASAAPPGRPATADACISIFLWGGPPQQDMWDMKPDAPAGIRSVFSPIATRTPGFQVCDQMPLFARQTDKVAVVRSLTHASNNHEPSVYHMFTGRTNPTLAVPRNARSRKDFPSFPGVVSRFAAAGPVPAAVTLPRPIGHDGVTYAGTHAGFLGPRHDPVEQSAAKGSSAAAAHPTAIAPDFPAPRLVARTGLLKQIERADAALQAGPAADLDEFRDRAMRMLVSPAVRAAFDLTREPPYLRDRYGRNEYGESFLLARRLVEAGVKVVSTVWMYVMPGGGVANVWDNHGGTAGLGGISGFDMLKANYCLPPLDRALSALLEDLADRGMLPRTLVAVAGEFGRTPKINPTGGREHWGAAQTALFAGGGVRGGQIYGATDKIAAYPTRDPVSPEDYLATIYSALGVDPAAEVVDRDGRPHRVVDGTPISALFS